MPPSRNDHPACGPAPATRDRKSPSSARTAGIGAELAEEVAGHADIERIAERPGGADVDVRIRAALVLRRRIDEVVGHAGRDRELEGRGRHVGVAHAPVDRPMAHADAGPAVGIVDADRRASHDVGHDVVAAGLPLQRSHRIEVADARSPCRWCRPKRRCPWVRDRTPHTDVSARPAEKVTPSQSCPFSTGSAKV